MKKMNKIRKLLGRRFHLSTEYAGENCELTQWKLFKKYENGDPIYWSDDNKEIMSSAKHTIDDLYVFAKTHKKYDIERFILRMNLIIFIILLFVSIANVFINSVIIRTIILTCDFILMLWLGAVSYVSNKNYKVDCRELIENWKRHLEQLNDKKGVK